MFRLAKDEKGMALVISLLIMAVAAMIGIGIATDSTIDGQISRNQRNTTKDFFIGDGTNQIKIGQIMTDTSLLPKLFDKPEITPQDGSSDESLPDLDNLPNPPKFRARICYLYRRYTNAGFSIDDEDSFKYYYYTTQTKVMRNNLIKTSIKTTEKKLGK